MCSCDITLKAAPRSRASATRNAAAATSRSLLTTLRHTVEAARSDSGRNAVQIAARPAPTAMETPPSTRQSNSDQTITRAPDPTELSDPSARRVPTATATYAVVNRAVAAGTVQSRTPSAIASASGP